MLFIIMYLLDINFIVHGPKSTCLKSAVISEERKTDLTPVKFLFCFKQFIKKYFMYWTKVV